MRLFSIGFTKTTAENFFERLRTAGVRKVIDVRLNNTSQLAGFAKARDLAFFLDRICGVGYRHEPKLAPTVALLEAYKKHKGPWETYEHDFLSLMRSRRIEDALDPDELSDACLLCSEAEPHHCHRRLVAEYLSEQWPDLVEVRHL